MKLGDYVIQAYEASGQVGTTQISSHRAVHCVKLDLASATKMLEAPRVLAGVYRYCIQWLLMKLLLGDKKTGSLQTFLETGNMSSQYLPLYRAVILLRSLLMGHCKCPQKLRSH